MSKLVSNEELIYTNMLQLEAIMRILEKKKLVSSLEILEEVEKLEGEMEGKMRKSSKKN